MSIGGLNYKILDSRIMLEGTEFIGTIEGTEKLNSKKAGEFFCYYFNTGKETFYVPYFSIASKLKFNPADMEGKKVKLIVQNKKLFLSLL